MSGVFFFFLTHSFTSQNIVWCTCSLCALVPSCKHVKKCIRVGLMWGTPKFIWKEILKLIFSIWGVRTCNGWSWA